MRGFALFLLGVFVGIGATVAGIFYATPDLANSLAAIRNWASAIQAEATQETGWIVEKAEDPITKERRMVLYRTNGVPGLGAMLAFRCEKENGAEWFYLIAKIDGLLMGYSRGETLPVTHRIGDLAPVTTNWATTGRGYIMSRPTLDTRGFLEEAGKADNLALRALDREGIAHDLEVSMAGSGPGIAEFKAGCAQVFQQ